MSDSAQTILIGGDTVPTASNLALFEAGDAEGLVGAALLDEFRAADFAVLNLETPLAAGGTPIAKCGPCLSAPASAARGLAAINPHAFSMANNHIMDQGAEGLASTLEALDGAGCRHFGAGGGLSEASEPYIFEKNGVRVGFYACAEHEFSIAGDAVPGANPFDPLESPDHVAALKARCDYVVVLYHGGKEHYRYPSPGLRKTCRKLAEKGADLVVCQHSHCVGCAEGWGGSTIVYGQGNFLFDDLDSEFWRTGLLLRLRVSGDSLGVEYLPLLKDGATVRLAVGEDADGIMAGFRGRSEEIARPGFVEERYAAFAKESLPGYLMRFAGPTLPVKALRKLTGGRWPASHYGRSARLAIQNALDCEAHRELASAGLGGAE